MLKIVIAFLRNRTMLVKYKGKQSTIKSLPGGGPQGTLLALLLFLVLINDVGFENQTNNAGDIVTSKRNMKIVNEIHIFVCLSFYIFLFLSVYILPHSTYLENPSYSQDRMALFPEWTTHPPRCLTLRSFSI